MQPHDLPAGNRTRVFWITRSVLYHWATEAVADNLGVGDNYTTLTFIYWQRVYCKCQILLLKLILVIYTCYDIIYSSKCNRSEVKRAQPVNSYDKNLVIMVLETNTITCQKNRYAMRTCVYNCRNLITVERFAILFLIFLELLKPPFLLLMHLYHLYV